MENLVNIDKCYLVLISRLTNSYEKDKTTYFESKKVKFTVIVREGVYSCYDLLSDEKYENGLTPGDLEGTMFVNNKYYIIPLNAIVKTKNSKVKKIKIIKELRDSIIKLNELLVFEDENLILNKENIKNIFATHNEKIKSNMYKRRSKI